MSGSLPHVIAVSNHTTVNTQSSGYTPFDTRSDEDKNIAALNARNAKASSDFVVTISEEAQALQQRKQKFQDDEVLSRLSHQKIEEDFTDETDFFYEDDIVYEDELEFMQSSSEIENNITTNNNDKPYNNSNKTAGDFLDKIV